MLILNLRHAHLYYADHYENTVQRALMYKFYYQKHQPTKLILSSAMQ